MNSFSFNRFGKTLRWVLAVNFRTLLMWTVGASLGVFLGEMLLLKINSWGEPSVMINTFSNFGSMLLVIVTLIFISSIVATINDKRKRETFLMLPSTTLEKFLSLLLYTTVINTLCVFLAMVIGDLLRMGWLAVSSGNGYSYSADGDTWYWWSSTIPQLVKNLTSPFYFVDGSIYKYTLGYRMMQAVVTIGFGFWIHSLYTLGGTLLRKYAFVATSVVMILCFLLFGKLVMTFELSMFTSEWIDDHYVSQEVGAAAYVLGIVLPLFSILNYWASFQIFKGFQLITNKWMNYDILKR